MMVVGGGEKGRRIEGVEAKMCDPELMRRRAPRNCRSRFESMYSSNRTFI